MKSERIIRCAVAASICSSVLIVVGCEGMQSQHTSISGAVQFSGEPIVVGEIRFVPIQGTKAPTVGGIIEKGRYELSGQQGLPVGKYRVEVFGYRNRSGDDSQINLSDAEADYEQYVPLKHNKHSQETLNVDSIEKPIVSDYALPE